MILMAEFSSSANGIWGSSVARGAAYKSHRPTNGVKTAGGVFDGEGYATGTQIFKLTPAEARIAIQDVLADKSRAPSRHHVSYINPQVHTNGSNYVFVDGHAARFSLDETLDPGSYMWGRKVYSCVDKPVVQDNPERQASGSRAAGGDSARSARQASNGYRPSAPGQARPVRPIFVRPKSG